MLKTIKYILAVSVLLLIATELFLRMLGFGNPVLFEASNDYGYRVVPNQDVWLLGKRIYINAQGLRSEPIPDRPGKGVMRILCVGDSITYGGTQLDQSQTYPAQLQNILNRNSKTRFEVLNASAPGWSIRNEEVFLFKKGIYRSHLLVLQMGDEDLFQEKSESWIPGRLAEFPVKKPAFALEEFLERYLKRYVYHPGNKKLKLRPFPADQILANNFTSVKKIIALAKEKNANVILVFVPTPSRAGICDMLYSELKAKLVEITKESDIIFLDLEPVFKAHDGQKLFLDQMHPNIKGSTVIAEAVERIILDRYK